MNLPVGADSGRALPRGFMVLHGNRLEDLRDLLTAYFKANPLACLLYTSRCV